MKGKLDTPKAIERWKGSQRRIGITGGIASGKSSVGKFLKEFKALQIIDADIFAKEALGPGKEATYKVLERFGSTICEKQGNKSRINRSTLGKIIFSDKREKLWLESVIHPIVKLRLKKELERKKQYPVVVLIIPLLFEADLTNLCSEIWFVDCTPEEQLKRLIARDNCSTKEALLRINAQWSMEVKKKLSDVVIENNGNYEVWKNQIKKLL